MIQKQLNTAEYLPGKLLGIEPADPTPRADPPALPRFRFLEPPQPPGNTWIVLGNSYQWIRRICIWKLSSCIFILSSQHDCNSPAKGYMNEPKPSRQQAKLSAAEHTISIVFSWMGKSTFESQFSLVNEYWESRRPLSSLYHPAPAQPTFGCIFGELR